MLKIVRKLRFETRLLCFFPTIMIG